MEGLTDYPQVDAGMRRLNMKGWMHNMVRMVTASFLSKHPMHYWKLEEQHFAEKTSRHRNGVEYRRLAMVGCVIGKQYPAPIVNHSEATRKFKKVYFSMKS